MRSAWFIDIIKSFSGRLRVDNPAGYTESYSLDDLEDTDFVTKELLGAASVDTVEITYPSGTELPIVMINGEDFTTLKLRPIVWATISSGDDTDTTDGINPLILDYTFTDSTKNILQSITIRDNGMGTLPADAVVTVVG